MWENTIFYSKSKLLIDELTKLKAIHSSEHTAFQEWVQFLYFDVKVYVKTFMQTASRLLTEFLLKIKNREIIL